MVRLLQPDALTRALRALQPACPLMLLQSAEAVAEAAGGSAQQRARSLSRFLLRMSGLLAEPPGVPNRGRAGGTRGLLRVGPSPRVGVGPSGIAAAAATRPHSDTDVVQGDLQGAQGLGDAAKGLVESGQDGGNRGAGGYGGVMAPASSLLVCSQVDVEGSGQVGGALGGGQAGAGKCCRSGTAWVRLDAGSGESRPAPAAYWVLAGHWRRRDEEDSTSYAESGRMLPPQLVALVVPACIPTHQDNKYSMLLRQYATVRLVLAHAGEAGAAGGRAHSFPGVLPVVAELRKCPWLSTRWGARRAALCALA